MKKLIFFTSLIIVLLSAFAVSAHEGRYDFFDFESYTGNDKTLSDLPNGGTYGNFSLNNKIGELGSDGVTSELTDKGTSLVLVRRYAKYPGVYYTYKQSSYDVTDTLHTSLSFKINGTISEGYGVFRFRKRGSSSPYNIAVFNNNGTISVMGETLKKDGAKIYYSKDKWYDLDVVYDVKSGYCKVHITGEDGFDVYYEGCSGYEKNLTSIQLVMFETVGSIKDTEQVAKIYLDNWKIETVTRQYATNEAITFDDFNVRTGGTSVPKGYMLTGFLAKSNSSTGYSAVSVDEDDTGKKLVLSQNIERPLTLSGSFKNKIVEPVTFEADLTLNSLNSDTVIYLGNPDEGCSEALRVLANTGDVYAFGKRTGIHLAVNKNYSLKLSFDPKTSQGYLTCYEGTEGVTSKFENKDVSLTWFKSYKLALENYTNSSGNTMNAVFDNLKLYARDNIYHPINETPYDFDIAVYAQESENTFLVRMNNPIDVSDSFVARVNREVASAQVIDAHTVRITYPMDPGEANIKLAGIADVYGNSVTANCEIQKVSIPEGFIVSNPVFLADSLGVESEIDSATPGELNAVINIKKSN